MFLRHGHGFFLAGLFLMSATAMACADEGMWVFNNLPLGTLKARYGFEPPAGWADHLRSAADRHAIDMRDNNAHLQPGTDGHTGSDGSRPDKRIKDAGFAPLSKYGEIIYWSNSASTPEATVDWWMNRNKSSH